MLAYLDTLDFEEAAEVIDTDNIAKDVTKNLHEVKGQKPQPALISYRELMQVYTLTNSFTS